MIIPYADEIEMIIIRYMILETGAYYTVKSTTSRMYEPYVKVLEQILH